MTDIQKLSNVLSERLKASDCSVYTSAELKEHVVKWESTVKALAGVLSRTTDPVDCEQLIDTFIIPIKERIQNLKKELAARG